MRSEDEDGTNRILKEGVQLLFDSLEHALRRWRQLCPNNGEVPSPVAVLAISRWLEHDVCRIVQDLIARPDFRSLARWSMDHLVADNQTEVRCQVAEIELSLRETARDLANALRASDVRRAVIDYEAAQQRKPHRATSSVHHVTPTVVSESEVTRPTPTSAVAAVTNCAPTTVDPESYENMVKTLEYIASRPWRDLVADIDFFGPAVDLNLVDRSAWFGPDSQSAGVGDFLRVFEPLLQVPGDFIVRCLNIRIDYWRLFLRQTFVRIQSALLRQNGGPASQNAIREAMKDVESPYRQLEIRCRHDHESRQREAAMALVQIYYAYRPQADAGWLGEACRMVSLACNFRYFLERQNEIAIADTVAMSLYQLQEFYHTPVDVELLITEKSTSYPLCLIEGPGRREAYWKGARIEADWEKCDRAWKFFSSMVEKAQTKQSVGPDDVRVSLKDARAELKKLLPRELFVKMTVNRGEYLLKLPKHEIYFGRIDSTESLQEII